ncbi:MAG: AAA family ATPase [Bacteroidales bacterium]|nr:AAA family ATPase [Bacteroidales bacterium]
MEGSAHEDIIYERIHKLEGCDDLKNLNSIDRYKGDVFAYKLLKAYTSRILITVRKILIDNEDINFYFVMDFIPKKSFGHEWGNVIHPKLVDGSWIEENQISTIEIEKAKDEFRRIQDQKKSTKPTPPQELIGWLDKFSAKTNLDILEFEEWASYSSNPNQSGLEDKYFLSFKNLISLIVHENYHSLEYSEIKHNLFIIENEKKEVGLLFSRHIIGERNNPIYVIRGGANLHKQKNNWEEIVYKAQLLEIDIENNLEILTKKSFRAYPKWILNENEYNLWEVIQRHNKENYNLSLLPEQINFLNDFKFPTYINGQAGSGKSTMLYYLFANVFSHKIAGEFKGDIIFLTENEGLIEQTKNTIVGLLNSNPDFHLALSLEQQNDVKQSFITFLDFLRGFLPDFEVNNFPKEKYMDFAKFKALYNKKHQRRYSAEEVWFVINTYVLGYDENEIIDTKEKYLNKVVRDFQIIPVELFKDILEDAFPYFKKLIEEDKFWTKTSLARKIHKLFPDKLPKHYITVFCDEAQDFTRIELRLIIYSSVYMNYNLALQDQIPIVFAGDALQTVSPNRFTLKRLKQMYYSIFEESKYVYSKERQDRTIYTPTYNYRSLESIVRVSNFIQQFRYRFLDEDMYIKQQSKRTSNNALIPMLHYKEWLTQPNNFEIYRNKFKYKSFIIPSDLNEDDYYIRKNNDIFPYKIEIDSEGNEIIKGEFADVKSSINAKGAEYSEVVVCGFGDQYIEEFGHLLLNSINEYNNYKYKFFFNKLYVAITRAQNELIIIDSKNAADKFWIPLFESVNSMPSSWENYQELDEVLLINPKSLTNVKESTKEDALANAKKDKEQGILDKNAVRLILAANIFQILGENQEANECHGYSNLIKGNWQKAGDYFLNAGNRELASDSYFRGQVWDKISRGLEGNVHEARVLIANLMKTGTWGSEDIKIAYDIRNFLHDVLKDVIWYTKFSEKLQNYVNTISSVEIKRDLAFIIESIIKDDDYVLWRVAAELYYSSSQLEKAIEAWEKYVFENEVPRLPANYIKSKLQIAKNQGNVEEELLWIGRLISDRLALQNNEHIALATNLLNLLSKYGYENISNENLHEIDEYMFLSLIITGKKENLHQFAQKLEKHSTNDLTRVAFYKNAIYLTNDETTSLFLKERWAFFQAKLLKNKSGNLEDSESIVKELNMIFENEDFPFEKSNYPWTVNEISRISYVPQLISENPPNHLTDIEISYFRKFKKIQLKNLGKYNLILGDNNSGKTSLLEALLFSNIPNQQLSYLSFTHKLRRNGTTLSTNEIIEDIKTINTPEDQHITYFIANGRHSWEYTFRSPSFEEIQNKINSDIADPKNYLVIKKENSNIDLQFSDSLTTIINQATFDIPFIPFGKGFSSDLANMYYELIGSKDRKSKDKFLSTIRLFIPKIYAIEIRPSDDSIIIEERIDDDNFKTSPLYNYGEGANKLFRILMQIYNAKGKRLMIDEIDAGIHYSRFKNFWKVILNAAKDLDVQLFVTTHNEECINYFHEVLSEEEFNCCRQDSRLITLEFLEDEDRVISIIRDFESFDYAIKHKLEIRGDE